MGAVLVVQPRARRPASPPAAQDFHVSAPIGGINTVAAALELPAGDCLSGVNVISAENGLRVRLGYAEWCTGLTGAHGDIGDVRTIIPFTGSHIGSGRLFATTQTGIWDVSQATQSPTRVADFSEVTDATGVGVSTVVVTQAGHFLLYADEADGLWLYAESGATWTRVEMGTSPGQISGVDPHDLCFVTVFKNRVWFAERGTGDAWYLDPGLIAGVAHRFPMGALFRAGGVLVGLWDWTYDGGSGLDDSLVAISSGGDVLVYQGTDPSVLGSFGLKGVWSIGPPPAGRRVATPTGGELLVVSRRGVVPMSKLVVGALSQAQYTTAKISNLVSASMATLADQTGWALVEQQADSTLLLLKPKGYSESRTQFVQSLVTGSWFTYAGLDMACAASWNSLLYYGTSDGRVCVQQGYVDGVLLEAPAAFTPVDWSILTAPTNFGNARKKMVGLTRPIILSDATPPAVKVAVRYDLDPTPGGTAVIVPAVGNNVWDSAIWDYGVWAGIPSPSLQVQNASGVGISVSFVVTGRATSKTIFAGLDGTFVAGGFL